MYKRDVVPTIREICRDNGIRFKYNKSEFTWYFPQCDATVYVFTAEDDGQSIKGPNLAWFLINEITLCSKMAFLMAISRVRIKEAKFSQVGFSGTPEGFDWTFEEFIEKIRHDCDVFYGDSRDNTYLADAYVGLLRSMYDEQMQKQYIEGKNVNRISRQAAYMWNREKHTSKVERRVNLPVHITIDFNVDPMAAVLWNVVPLEKVRKQSWARYEYHAFEEICIQGTDTWALSDALLERVDPKTQDVILFPDPTGAARGTRSHFSDIDILRKAGFSEIQYKSKINVRNALNAYNNALSKGWIMVDLGCKNFIADNERCVLKKDVFEIDKSDLKRSHWLDGAKNMFEILHPVEHRSVSAVRSGGIR